jgi:hypothetical protein
MIYDAAISYAKEETARLEEAEAILVRDGLSVWTDRGLLRLGEGEDAERLVPAGIEHWEAIRDGIDHSATFVFLDSPLWRASEYCRKEHAHAHERGMRMIALGGVAGGRADAGARVPEGDPGALVAAVRGGLDVSRAHARVRVAAFTAVEAVATPNEEVTSEDVTTLAEVHLEGLGMSLSPPMTARMDEALAHHRRRRRRVGTLVGTAIVVAAVLAAIAVIAGIAAQQDRGRAADVARHVESLAVAAASESSANTFARLAQARRAIGLEQNATTVAALRDAVESFGKGISMRLAKDEPIALAVADDGDVATVQHSGAVTLVAAAGDRAQREVAAEAAGAGPSLVFAPDGSKLVVVRREGGAAEVVDFKTARLTRVAGTANLVGVLFASDRRAIAVSHDGEVLEFDPQDPQPRASRVQWVLGPVRAAALASLGPEGTFGLATLANGAVEVTEVGRPAAPWRAPLPLPQAPFSLGWESLRVCGDHLSVLASGAAHGLASGFGIPYTVSAAGEVVQTRSLIHSAGSICLPEGRALAADPLQGQFAFPADGPTLPDLIGDPAMRVTYAIASSENGQWAAAAGADGTLKIVELESYGRTRQLRSLETVAPTAAGDPLVVAGGAVLSVPVTGGAIHTVAAASEGNAARGAYLDPRLGTVLAIGEDVLVVRGGRVRERIPVGGPVYAIHPGRPGVSALVILEGANRALDVPLDGGRSTSVELPDDTRAGATQLSDAIELPGSPPHLVTAATDGHLDLIAYPSGGELRRRRVAPSGPIALGLSQDGRLVSSSGDGVVRIHDPRTLTTEASRQVFPPGPSLVTTDASGKLAAVFAGGGEAVVLELPSLDPITHDGPIEALNSVAFGGDHGIFLGADIHLIGGGDEASITSWPLCIACAGGPARLRATAAALAKPRPSSERARFVPVRDDRDTRGEKGLAVATPAGVGDLHLGATAASLLRRHLIGPLRPGCELDPGQQVADLLPPLRGNAVFSDPNTRLSSIVVTGGAATSRGIGIGASAITMLGAYPKAEFEPPHPNAPIPAGLLTVMRGEDVLMTMAVDFRTRLVSEIAIPYANLCE